jgi:hypothetical protein
VNARIRSRKTKRRTQNGAEQNSDERNIFDHINLQNDFLLTREDKVARTVPIISKANGLKSLTFRFTFEKFENFENFRIVLPKGLFSALGPTMEEHSR